MSKEKRIGTKNKGFTLLELMIAVLLLGIVLTPLLEIFSRSSRISADSWFETTALNLAQSKLEEVKDLPFDDVVCQSGVFPENPEYAYELTVTPDPEYSFLIKIATVKVSCGDGDGGRSVELTITKLKR
ncbi:MAG TPA: type II secretion system protein [Bacillota bacterium]|nr:type II secretion system protein [Bacillota bacterium]